MERPSDLGTIGGMSPLERRVGIGRCRGICAVTGETLPPGTSIVAALCEPTAEEQVDAGSVGLIRRDYSITAWEQGPTPTGVVCFWRTIVPESARPAQRLDEGVLLELLERLSEEADPRRERLRLVLALVLLRRRRLRLVDRRTTSGEERWTLEHRGGDGEAWTVEVAAPRMSEEDSRAVADELGALLGGELVAAGAATP